MRTLRPMLGVIFCGLLTLPAMGEEGEKKYAIKLERRAAVGETYSVESSISMTIDIPGKEKQTHSANLIGTIKIEGVNTDGKPTEFTLTIKKFTGNDPEDELMEAGTKVHVKRDGSGCTLTEGEDHDTVEGEAASKLNLLIGPVSTADANDDDVARTSKQRKVGETWEGDYDAARNVAEAQNVEMDPKRYKITVTLKEARKVEGVACLVVEKSETGWAKKLPPMTGYTPLGADFREKITYIVPEDKSAKDVVHTREAGTEIKAVDAAGAEVKIVTEHKATETLKLVKEGK